MATSSLRSDSEEKARSCPARGRARRSRGGGLGLLDEALTAVVAAVLLFTTACTGDGASGADDGFVIVASTSVLADLTDQVVGDHAEVFSLVPVGGDPHVHEPTPGDVRTLERADLVIHNGAGLEPWLASLLRRVETPTVALSETVQAPLLGDGESGPDPHLWMAPPHAISYVWAIADAVTALLPEERASIDAAADEAIRALRALDDELRDRLTLIPAERRKLVTSHDAYGYFADHYDLEVIGTVVGVSTEEEPSAAAVRRLVDVVRQNQVPTIFVETTVNPGVIESIARDAGVKVGTPLYGDSLGPPGSGAETYAGMMRSNVEALLDGLAG
jgi:manganese/iron transport system substrate-binding protein